MAPDAVAREVSLLQGNQTLLAQLHTHSRGILSKLEVSSDKGELRMLTQLILDFSEVCLIFACIRDSHQSTFTP
jgi:hypothetical protein